MTLSLFLTQPDPSQDSTTLVQPNNFVLWCWKLFIFNKWCYFINFNLL